jgi:hypothetical protein
MGFGFCGANQTSKTIYMKQIHISGHKLCNQMSGSQVLRINIETVRIKFLYECIFTGFGCPLIIVIYQGVHFINDVIKHLIDHFLLKHVSSTTYYP